jgi:hypothetical protein
MMRDAAGALLVGGYVHRGVGGLTQQTRSNAPLRPFYARGVTDIADQTKGKDHD